MPTMQVEGVDEGLDVSVRDFNAFLGPLNPEVFAGAHTVTPVDVLLLAVEHPILHGLMDTASGDVGLEGLVLVAIQKWVVLGVRMPLHVPVLLSLPK
jgi:hypothetical protein